MLESRDIGRTKQVVPPSSLLCLITPSSHPHCEFLKIRSDHVMSLIKNHHLFLLCPEEDSDPRPQCREPDSHCFSTFLSCDSLAQCLLQMGPLPYFIVMYPVFSHLYHWANVVPSAWRSLPLPSDQLLLLYFKNTVPSESPFLPGHGPCGYS